MKVISQIVCLLILFVSVSAQYKKRVLRVQVNAIVQQIPSSKYLLEMQEKGRNQLEYSEYESDIHYYGNQAIKHLQNKFADLSYVRSDADEFLFFNREVNNNNQFGFWLVTKEKVLWMDTLAFWEKYAQFADCSDLSNDYCAQYHQALQQIEKNFLEK